MFRFLPLFVALLIHISSPLYAIEITLEQQAIELGPDSQYWFDTQGQADFSQAQTAYLTGKFTRLGKRVGAFGNTTGPLWYRLVLENPSEQPLNRILVTGLNDQIALAYLSQQEAEPKEILPWQTQGWKITYLLDLPPHSKTIVYLKFTPLPGVTQYRNLQLFDFSGLLANEQKLLSLGMIVYGAFLALGLYNLFLFLSLKDISYFYYICMLVADCLLLSSVDGFGIHYLWDGATNPSAGYFGGLCLGLFLALFLRQLFSTKANMPKAHLALNTLIILSGLLILAIPFNIPLVAVATLIYGVSVPLIPLTVGFLALKTSPRTALFFLVGWSVYLVSITGLSIQLMGQMPLDVTLTEITYYMKVAALFEMILFSLALADRINTLNKEKLNAQQELAQAAKQQAALLEKKVTARTKELILLNQTKDRFFSIISHDLRGPVGSLSVIFNEVLRTPSDLEESMFQSLRTTTKSAAQLLSNLLDWASVQTGHLKVDLTIFKVQLVIEEVVSLLQPQAQHKQISIKINVDEKIYFNADRSMITTVIRNLISNAIKFSSKGDTIEVGAKMTSHIGEVYIKDTGVGIRPEDKSKLFSIEEKVSHAGTSGETGSGLGLILCHEFIMSHQGEIGIESKRGEGSKFWFKLKVVEPMPLK